MGVWAVLLLALLVAPGCSRAFSVGAGYRAGDDLTFYIPLCRDDERVIDVRVDTFVDPDRGQVGQLVWGTRPAGDAGPVTHVGVDAPPPGYEKYGQGSLASLVNDYADRRLRVTVRTTSVDITSVFTISELPPDGSIDFGRVDPEFIDPRDVADFQERQCDPRLWPWPVSMALAALYSGSVVALAVYLLNSARHRRRLADRRTTA